MDIFREVLLGVFLVIFLGFHFRAHESRFEINRLAEKNHKYKILEKFLNIYPGILFFARILALVSAIFIIIFATLSWGIFGGFAISFGILILAFLLSRALFKISEEFVARNFKFFNKYFSWAEIFSRLAISGGEMQIHSEEELLHLISRGDFLDESTKIFLKNSLKFRAKIAGDLMTPRDKIAFIHSKDPLTPVFLAELFDSGRKIFPVVQGNLDKTVGILYLDDVALIDQEEKILAEAMRKCPPPVDFSANAEKILEKMREFGSTVLLVARDEKIVGLITLTDVARALFAE